MKKNIYYIISFLFLFLILFLGSCNNNQNRNKIQTPCPTAFEINDINNENQPLLIFTLVQGTPSYEENGYFNDSIDTMINILPKVINPGDWFIMAFMEKYQINQAVFVDQSVEKIDITPISPKPIIDTYIENNYPSQTLSVTPNVFQSELEKREIEIKSTQTFNHYNCDFNEWYSKYKDFIIEWNDRKNNNINIFIDKVNQDIETINQDNFIEKIGIYESISMASNVLYEECSTGKYKCKFIIFSYMVDWRSNQYDLNLDFSNVDVEIVLLDCKFKINCTDRINKWEDFFTHYNVNSIEFSTSKDIDQIEDFLRRK